MDRLGPPAGLLRRAVAQLRRESGRGRQGEQQEMAGIIFWSTAPRYDQYTETEQIDTLGFGRRNIVNWNFDHWTMQVHHFAERNGFICI